MTAADQRDQNEKPLANRGRPHMTVRGAPWSIHFPPRQSVLGKTMSSRHSTPRKSVLTMHGWTAKHYIVTAIILLAAVGMFAYSWS